MAELIPPLRSRQLHQSTAGERQVAQILGNALSAETIVWLDVPIGPSGWRPDCVVFHPVRGFLFIEIKDWKLDAIRRLDRTSCTLSTNEGIKEVPAPLQQALGYARRTVDLLKRDRHLVNRSGKYQGKLLLPWGTCVVFTGLSRKSLEERIDPEVIRSVLPMKQVLFREDLDTPGDDGRFEERLWEAVELRFGQRLTPPQQDRVRWHLFPEIRLPSADQGTLFADEEAEPKSPAVLDFQQERLARSLGTGHRVIHGVAGSGKTAILKFRCRHLAALPNQRILLLCFNALLAADLRGFVRHEGLEDRVEAWNFHHLCRRQVERFGLPADPALKPYEAAEAAVLEALAKGRLPADQYSAVLIDEGHDFKPEWLRLAVHLVDSKTDSLLLAYDDAQSIFQQRRSLGFSLSAANVQARGRTSVLRINYRNTAEILRFAYEFADSYLIEDAERKQVPWIEPEAAGTHGPDPVFRLAEDEVRELRFVADTVRQWINDGKAPNSIMILFCHRHQGPQLESVLRGQDIPLQFPDTAARKRAYDPGLPSVTMTTLHSSKGLEAENVVLCGIQTLPVDGFEDVQQARQLYVGMTRARYRLVVSGVGDHPFCRQLATQVTATR